MSTETSPPHATGGVARAALSFRRHLPKHTARLLLLLQFAFVARVHGERLQRPKLRAILKDQLGVPDEQIPSGMYAGRQSELQKIVITKALDELKEFRENETPEIQAVINAPYDHNGKAGRDTFIRSLLPLLKRREDAAILQLRKDQIKELKKRDDYVRQQLQGLSTEKRQRIDRPKNREDLQFRANWFSGTYEDCWRIDQIVYNERHLDVDSFFENDQYYIHKPETGWNLGDVLPTESPTWEQKEYWPRPTPSVLRSLGYLQSQRRRRLDALVERMARVSAICEQ